MHGGCSHPHCCFSPPPSFALTLILCSGLVGKYFNHRNSSLHEFRFDLLFYIHKVPGQNFARPIRLRRNSGRTATVAVRGSRARRPADRPHTAAREPATPAARAARLERPLGGQGVLGVRRRADSAGGDSASNGDHRRCGAGEVLACPTPRRLLPRLARARAWRQVVQGGRHEQGAE